MLTVVINDFVGSKRIKLSFDAEDFEVAASAWDKSDALFEQLQMHPMYAGRYLWRDLEPLHYREMIAQNLQYVSTLSDDVRVDDDHPVVSSLNFLIVMLAYSIEQRLGANIELLKLSRVGEYDVAVEFTAELQMDIAPPSKRGDTPSGITVVVDNT